MRRGVADAAVREPEAEDELGELKKRLAEAEKVDGISIAHAATKKDGEQLLATGGRVLSVVALANDFAAARAQAYEALSKIHLEGSHFRSDIAAKVISAENGN